MPQLFSWTNVADGSCDITLRKGQVDQKKVKVPGTAFNVDDVLTLIGKGNAQRWLKCRGANNAVANGVTAKNSGLVRADSLANEIRVAAGMEPVNAAPKTDETEPVGADEKEPAAV